MKLLVATFVVLSSIFSSPISTSTTKAFVSAQSSPQPQPQRKNNLLVILTDQQRYDTIRMVQEERGWPERSRIRTPNLDRIAREGAYFKNAYTHCAVCAPARASFLTGSTIENTGIRTNSVSQDENLPGSDAEYKLPNRPTYDRILVEQYNYTAEYYGKWHTPNSMAFGVYSNDVRRGGGARSWFGKYNEDGSKHYSWGMTEWYRMWLEEQPTALDAKMPFESGDQINTYSKYYYDPDPLDSRYGAETSADRSSVRQPDQHGMNRLDDGLSKTAQQGAETVEALDRLAKTGEPFSLHLSLHSPHAPMIPTKKYHDMYNPSDMMIPASLDDDMENSAYASRRSQRLDGYDDPDKNQRWTANYFGLITEIDEWMGTILDKLDEHGIAGNTLLAFSADHGEMLGSHGMREKNNFYEESSHIPLLLRMPGTIPAGTVVDDPVSHLDLHSTFLDYSVGRNDYASDGTTLRNNIEGVNTEDSFVVTMWNYTTAEKGYKTSRDPAFMIRKGDWKLILSGQEDNTNLDMLYNLATDPAEVNNFIGKNGNTASNPVIGKAEHLKAMLVKYLKEANHPAADEIQRRRTWRYIPFWAGDNVINFRDTLPDGTRTENVYIGLPNRRDVLVEIEGENADRYDIRLDYQGGTFEQGFAVVAVRYKGMDFIDSSPGRMIITLSDGRQRMVSLNPPRNIKLSTNSDLNSQQNDYVSTLAFGLDITKLPTKRPTPEPTAAPTLTKSPTLAPTTFVSCSGPSVLGMNRKLYADQEPNFICSPNGQHRFGMDSDGDLSLFHGPTKVWSANTGFKGNDAFAVMQSEDGNLVVRSYTEVDSEDEEAKALWASRTKEGQSILRITDEGQAQVVTPDGRVVWKTNAPTLLNPDVSVQENPTRVTPPSEENDQGDVFVVEPPVVEENEEGDVAFVEGDVAFVEPPDNDDERRPDIISSDEVEIFISDESLHENSDVAYAMSENTNDETKQSPKNIGAAIGLALSVVTLVVGIILIHNGLKGRHPPPPPPRAPLDGAFPVDGKLESTMDTSIDSDSGSDENLPIDDQSLRYQKSDRDVHISRQRSGVEVILPNVDFPDDEGYTTMNAIKADRSRSYDFSPILRA